MRTRAALRFFIFRYPKFREILNDWNKATKQHSRAVYCSRGPHDFATEAVFGLGQIHIRYEFPEQDEIRQLNRSIRREEDKLHLNYFVPELFDDERLLNEAKHWRRG